MRLSGCGAPTGPQRCASFVIEWIPKQYGPLQPAFSRPGQPATLQSGGGVGSQRRALVAMKVLRHTSALQQHPLPPCCLPDDAVRGGARWVAHCKCRFRLTGRCHCRWGDLPASSLLAQLACLPACLPQSACMMWWRTQRQLQCWPAGWGGRCGEGGDTSATASSTPSLRCAAASRVPPIHHPPHAIAGTNPGKAELLLGAHPPASDAPGYLEELQRFAMAVQAALDAVQEEEA